MLLLMWRLVGRLLGARPDVSRAAAPLSACCSACLCCGDLVVRKFLETQTRICDAREGHVQFRRVSNLTGSSENA